MYSTANISNALLDLLKGSNQGTPQGNRSPGQTYQEERDDVILESYEKERSLSPRELHKWKKSLFSVYVGRLPTDVTVRELVQFFSQVGVPKDAFVLPPEGNKSHTFGFLRYGTIEQAHKAVACMNGRILGNRHLLVEISAETRALLDDKEEGVCSAQDRLIRKDYPTFRRSPVPDNEEEFVQSKLLQSIAKLKSDHGSVIDAGYEDSEENDGPSFLDQLQEILKKVIKEVPGETTAKSTADEGPVCTIRLEDMRQNPTETPKTTQSVESPPLRDVGNGLHINNEHSYPGSVGSKMPGDMRQDSPVSPKSPEILDSPPVNSEKHSPINTVHPYCKPVQSIVSCHSGYVGLDMRQNMLQLSPETLKTNASLDIPPLNGEKHSPINTAHPYGKLADKPIACHPGSAGLPADMRQTSPEASQSIQRLGSPPMNGENHPPVNSNHSPVRPSNANTFITKSIGLNEDLTELQPKHYETAPLEMRKPADSHCTTNTSLLGDDLPMQELLISDGKIDEKRSPSDPYMLSQMRDIPCQDARRFQSEERPVAPCKQSPTAAQVSPLSRTDTVVDAATITPLSSKGNEISSMTILNARQISSNAAIGMHDHLVYPSLSFRERMADILDEKPGNAPPEVVTTFPGVMQGSMQRTQYSRGGEVAGLGEGMIVSPKSEDRGNDTRMQAQALESGGKDLCEPHPMNKEKDKDREDMEELSPQQVPSLKQNQTKVLTPPQEQLSPGQQEQPSLQDRQKQPPLQDPQQQPLSQDRQQQLLSQDRQQQLSLQDRQQQLSLQDLQQQSLLQDPQQQPLSQDRQQQPPLQDRQQQPPLQDLQQQPPLQDKQQQPPLQDRQQQPPLQDLQQQPPLQDKQQQPPLKDRQQQPLSQDRQQQPLSQDRQQQPQLQDRQQQPPLQDRQQQPPLQDRQQQPPLQDRQQQPPLQDRQQQPSLQDRQQQPSLQDRQQQSPIQDRQQQSPLQDRQQQPPLEDLQQQSPIQRQQQQPLLQEKQVPMPLQAEREQTLEQKQPPFEDQLSFQDRQQKLTTKSKQQQKTLQGQRNQMPSKQWEPAWEQNQQVQPPLHQQQLLVKQRAVHELQLKLGVILKDNERLHSALPEHYKDKRTSGMYPDKEMSNLEESIHNYEVEYQREIEISVARNAEHELLYEREKLSVPFDTNLQKELDLELQIEVLKNEIKLANMANQLFVLYQKRNDMQ